MDLSVVVTVHSETCVAGPTMRAADAAIAAAEAAGYRVERLIAYDRPTPEARAFFDQAALDHWRRIDVDGGDLGATRNAVVAAHVQGHAVAFLDADDLFSEHWLARGMDRLTAEGGDVIVHPELNWLYDGANSVYWNPDQDDPLFVPQYFYVMNYYDSLCICPRAAHVDVPYVLRDIPNGLSFQDWQFAVETMDRGWRHVNAPGTIIFKRRRDASLVTESRLRQSILRDLPALRIDRIAGLGRGASGTPRPPHPGAPALEDPMAALRALTARATRETPAYGAVFQARIARAAAKGRPVGEDAAYDATRADFDTAYYLACNADLTAAEKIDPVDHYIRRGMFEARDPSALFGTREVAARLGLDLPRAPADPGAPSVLARWRGAEDPAPTVPFDNAEAVARAAGLSLAEIDAAYAARYVDLRGRLMFGDLGAEVLSAARIDPLVTQAWPEALQVRIPPFHSKPSALRLTALLRAHETLCHRPARAVIVVNRPRFGGARRLEGHLAHALAQRMSQGMSPEEIVVISTDKPGAMPEGKFPAGLRHVDFATLIEGERIPQRPRLLVHLLRSLAPEVVFCVNSRLMWDALAPFGKALARSMRLVGCFLCNEQDLYGTWTGYPLRRFHRHFDILDAVITDSEALRAAFVADFLLPPDDAARIHTLAAPMPTPAPPLAPRTAPPPRDPARRPRIGWAGRLDPQKRVGLAFEIARALPEADLLMWGDPVSGNPQSWPPQPETVTRKGAYRALGDVPIETLDAWLYTSAWDGVPQMLLEIAGLGLPVVATDVGGVAEAVAPPGAPPDSHGVLIAPDAPPEAYATALRTILDDPAPAWAAAGARRAYLAATRTEAAYAADLWALLARIGVEGR